VPDTKDSKIRRLERLVRKQAAEIGQLKATVARLEHDNVRLRIERDEARAERDAARTESKSCRTELEQTKRQLADVKASLADLLRAVDHSGERLRALVRREFGASSERILCDDGYLPEVLEVLREEGLVEEEVAPAEPAEATTAEPGTPAPTPEPPARSRRRRPANAGGRNPLPEGFERRELSYDPPPDHPALRGMKSSEVIGTTVCERWHVGKPELHVLQITCPVARITSPSGRCWQETLDPPSVIPRSQASDAFLVRSAVDKVVDHLPSHRQEKRLARIDAPIARSKLCRWHMALGDFLQPLTDAIFDEILAEPMVGIDDTVHRLVVPDRHSCKHGRLWAVAGQSGIFYQFTETREGKWIDALLADYHGLVMGDAYAGHNQLLGRDDIIALFCWAHVRRKFFDAADKRRRKHMLDRIGQLYDIEAEIDGLSSAERVRERRARARPVLARIRELLDAWDADPKILPKSGIGKATAYALKLWDGLERYVDVGAAPIDNNRVERGMRPNALHRKNSLFSASVGGANAYATILTVTQSALLHDLNPEVYLNDAIENIHYDRLPLTQLTPQAYALRGAAGVKLPS
jgi:transposase/regulator of replication initiation timing